MKIKGENKVVELMSWPNFWVYVSSEDFICWLLSSTW